MSNKVTSLEFEEYPAPPLADLYTGDSKPFAGPPPGRMEDVPVDNIRHPNTTRAVMGELIRRTLAVWFLAFLATTGLKLVWDVRGTIRDKSALERPHTAAKWGSLSPLPEHSRGAKDASDPKADDLSALREVESHELKNAVRFFQGLEGASPVARLIWDGKAFGRACYPPPRRTSPELLREMAALKNRR